MIPPHLLRIFDRLDKLWMSQAACARRCGVAVSTLNRVLKGHVVITPQMAFKLECVLQLDASQTLKEQNEYQLQQFRKKANRSSQNQK